MFTRYAQMISLPAYRGLQSLESARLAHRMAAHGRL